VAMYNKLVKHIRKKLEDKGEIMDCFDIPEDKQIKYIMLTTIEIVNEECQQCFYCRNYKGFSLGSPCKIKPDTQDNCFHFTLDVNKVLKKKYYHILITINECTRGEHIINDKNLSQKTHKNIIYESIRLSETLKDFRQINNIESVSECAGAEE
jgi:hypothetical protein